ncbi:MAG: 3'-5' exonuclease [Candidatus Sumerlaeia bacterium]|nr:3'-5' exonuclease [Candidatus Sumerlaeia bacterium]
MPEYDFIAIDFETANEKRESVCAVGIAAVVGSHVERYSALIRPPEFRFSHWNMRVHGITPEMVRNAPTFGELYPSIRHFLDHPRKWAHNAPFDASVLRSIAAIERIQVNAEMQCTCRLAKNLLPALPNHKLPTVCRELAIPLTNHHDAASDAEACARIVLQLWSPQLRAGGNPTSAARTDPMPARPNRPGR